MTNLLSNIPLSQVAQNEPPKTMMADGTQNANQPNIPPGNARNGTNNNIQGDPNRRRNLRNLRNRRNRR